MIQMKKTKKIQTNKHKATRHWAQRATLGGQRPLGWRPEGSPRWSKATSQGQKSSSISLQGGDSMSLTSPSKYKYIL